MNEKLYRVFTFGSPPIASLSKDTTSPHDDSINCIILESLGIRPEMVYGYIQPWVSFAFSFGLCYVLCSYFELKLIIPGLLHEGSYCTDVFKNRSIVSFGW